MVRIQSAGNDVKGLHVSVIESDINKTTIFSDENIKLDNRVSQKNIFFFKFAILFGPELPNGV